MSFVSFKIAVRAVKRLGEIERLLGRWDAVERAALPPNLERTSLEQAAFETVVLAGSNLSLQQATAVLRGKNELVTGGDVLALENAHAAYQRLGTWDGLERSDLLEAHGVLMAGLVADAGKLRSGKRLADALKALFRFARQDEIPPLLTAVVFYAELLRLRPFSEGNGRIARLWLHALLRRASPLFEHAPLGAVMREHAKQHDAALAASARTNGDADYGAYEDAPIVDEMLGLALLALERATGELRGHRETAEDRETNAKKALGKAWFSRKAYRALFPRLSTASASRDLANALTQGTLLSRGEHALTEYRFR